MKLDIPVVGILRGITPDFLSPLMAASFSAGLQAIEVTFNTDGAEAMVRKQRASVPAGKWLGMGTIRNLDEAKRAVAADAMFIVTPNTDVDVIRFCTDQDIPVIAGALTPTEVYAAWSAGAAMVKVFPAGAYGPGYIRDLSGPFDQIPLVAVGGVTHDNVQAYFAAGAAAVGVGTTLFGKQALIDRSARAVGDHVQRFLNQIQA